MVKSEMSISSRPVLDVGGKSDFTLNPDLKPGTFHGVGPQTAS